MLICIIYFLIDAVTFIVNDCCY